MNTNETFYLEKLKSEFSLRQRYNSNYSLRAFARDLKIDSSNLSAILRNKRNLPTRRAKSIADVLKLSPKEMALFIGSTYRKKMTLDKIKIIKESKRYLLDESYYHVIAEWEHYAFLQLLKVDGFKHNIEWIAKRLGISKDRANIVINNLLRLKMIELKKDGTYHRITAALETSEDIESRALQKSHIENLELAKVKLEKTEVTKRDYSSITFAVDPKKIPEAKAIIREFQEKLYTLMSVSNPKEVYIFSSQLFPTTNMEYQNEK
ncbi:MAG: hypothetical protein A2381_12430 [Bdellovibrionales bacterium RIFOXYB1_FULL_37_110]|nr:MAG: hypothetical protein A2181_05690 [Bdellovibrionales bacterium RIFOXYA1_FULL_38_20]OFZ47347.1 MAG: hypothetical protein A2417_12000 [Bdellovibrionales bacterium RIFOXYC1_FULL_37_79]OFZ58522.1 MAG: hypothetical protein A2381_12430 [Bdellovibrionales bacterium RIFOXYB1_FULL_37_110]OFZ63570.1 MAG: hypothetical protein A2577_08580 [Bdellovibrionales bacterium RIFOXYD1_FULL_36_51]OFZ65975.1 MAG: hypothetical protein A2328_09285 [Bdellovibrionales bacterium RIFOXYB2_FULL_36_6]